MNMLGWIQSIVGVGLTFGLVIFLHEFGHFILCKWYQVRVERFAFGFGPELFGFTHDGTRFSICAVPLGGFVKPAGENLEECTGDPSEYFSKPWHQRFAIVAAGPFMNYLLAFLLFSGVVFFVGIPELSKDAVIGELQADYPAAQAGIKADDKIVKIGSTDISSWAQMADLIHASPNKAMEITLMRSGVTQHAILTPRLDVSSGHGLIGIVPKVEYRPVGMLGAAKEGLNQCWIRTMETAQFLAKKIRKMEAPRELSGPIGIVQMVSSAARSGLDNFLFFIGMISVAIGFLNIWPIPLLDGGHAAFYLWEGISGKKPTLKMMTVANSVGIVFLVSLMLFASYNDILRIRQSHREGKAAQEMPAPSPKSSPASGRGRGGGLPKK